MKRVPYVNPSQGNVDFKCRATRSPECVGDERGLQCLNSWSFRIRYGVSGCITFRSRFEVRILERIHVL